MRITKYLAAATIAVSLVAAGTANAEPLDADVAPGVHYTAYKDGTAAVITIDQGSLIVDNGQFQIRSAAGDILAGVPLEYNIDDIAFPIDAAIDGNTARLTPSGDISRAYYKPVALPFQDQAPWKTPYDREVAAWTRLTQTVALGAAIGAIVGAVGAGLLGCLLGGAVAAPTAVFTAVFGPLAGCVVGATTLAPVGAMAGAIFVGAPVAIAAFIQYLDTINAPFPATPR